MACAFHKIFLCLFSFFNSVVYNHLFCKALNSTFAFTPLLSYRFDSSSTWVLQHHGELTLHLCSVPQVDR